MSDNKFRTPEDTASKVGLPSHLDLDLPADNTFLSEPPVYSAGEMIRICEAQLRYWNKRRFVDAIDHSFSPVNEEFRL